MNAALVASLTTLRAAAQWFLAPRTSGRHESTPDPIARSASAEATPGLCPRPRPRISIDTFTTCYFCGERVQLLAMSDRHGLFSRDEMGDQVPHRCPY
jgi:hypothetical protein